MSRIKVRFNLGRGANYMKWKVTYPDRHTEYYVPTETQLILKNPQVKNQKSAAMKIFKGGAKVVCAWVLCDELEIRTNNFNQSDIEGQRIRYNPRVKPNWLMNGVVIDDMKFSRIESVDYGLYLIY